MKTLTLMYHDVTGPGIDASGFPGGEAARYKLTVEQFERHLAAIAGPLRRHPVTTDILTNRGIEPTRPSSIPPVLLTFDDGGVCAAEYIAGALEARGWRGHFFVTTAYIGRRGFLTRSQIQALRGRGHVVGSHTHTHPLRMGRCSEARQRDEWARSVTALAEIIGEPIRVASVPGGHCTEVVARTARDAGIQFLFTSEPTSHVESIDSLLIFGRYSVRRSTSAATAAAIANGERLPWVRQSIAWRFKAVAKATGGTVYDRGRAWILGRSPQMMWGDEPDAVSEEPT